MFEKQATLESVVWRDSSRASEPVVRMANSWWIQAVARRESRGAIEPVL